MKRARKDLVSVIMPSYNASRYIGASIDSILGQTYRRLELLISDDHSTDPETIELLKHYAEKDKRVRIFLLPENNGPGYARNNSIREARGRYIAFCDSDDRWMPEKLEKQIAYMKKHKKEIDSYLKSLDTSELYNIIYSFSTYTHYSTHF